MSEVVKSKYLVSAVVTSQHPRIYPVVMNDRDSAMLQAAVWASYDEVLMASVKDLGTLELSTVKWSRVL